MVIYTPFTYLIRFKLTGQVYYGSKYGKGAHPSCLGTTYLSSSEDMKNLIRDHGLLNFEFEVRRTFRTAKEAVAWETRFLTRVDAVRNPKFLNKTNGDGKFFNTSSPTPEHRAGISKARTGKVMSQETKDKIAAARRALKGKIKPYTRTEQTKKKLSDQAKAMWAAK